MSNLKIKVAMRTAKKYVNQMGYERVDHTNDAEMVREGIRLPKRFIDRSVFKKSVHEKTLLKALRRKGGPRGSHYNKLEPTHKFKLIVYMKNSPKIPSETFKSTHSFMCYENEVLGILSELSERGYNIKQAFFNNKRVKSHEWFTNN